MIRGDMRFFYVVVFRSIYVLMRCLYMIRGDIFFFMFLFYLCLCSCFTNYDTLVMTYIMRLFLVYVFYIMRLFMVYVFYFMFCENKKFILVYLYFPHMHLWFV